MQPIAAIIASMQDYDARRELDHVERMSRAAARLKPFTPLGSMAPSNRTQARQALSGLACFLRALRSRASKLVLLGYAFPRRRHAFQAIDRDRTIGWHDAHDFIGRIVTMAHVRLEDDDIANLEFVGDNFSPEMRQRAIPPRSRGNE